LLANNALVGTIDEFPLSLNVIKRAHSHARAFISELHHVPLFMELGC